uniref:Uncharacterized protein n=1 Tax=Hordeum vulgare subsp. vulgare TaxID=112509 RepID=A0A8I6X730_HORVV
MRAGGAEEESALRARNQTGATALHEAVRHRRAGVVDLLMTEAPHLSSVDGDDGVSPLYLAAATHSVQTVHALLRPSENGTPSPASFSGPEGRTALHIAATVSEGTNINLFWTWTGGWKFVIGIGWPECHLGGLDTRARLSAQASIFPGIARLPVPLLPVPRVLRSSPPPPTPLPLHSPGRSHGPRPSASPPNRGP